MDCPRKSWWLFAGVIAPGRVGGCLRVIRVGRWSATGRVSGRLWAYRQAACRVCGCASDRGLVGGCARSVYTMPEVRYTDYTWCSALMDVWVGCWVGGWSPGPTTRRAVTVSSCRVESNRMAAERTLWCRMWAGYTLVVQPDHHCTRWSDTTRAA